MMNLYRWAKAECSRRMVDGVCSECGRSERGRKERRQRMEKRSIMGINDMQRDSRRFFMMRCAERARRSLEEESLVEVR